MGREQIEMTVRTTVEELLSRMAAGDAERIAELFAEEVDFMCAGSEKVPWIRPRRTRRDMADFFSSINENFVPEDRSASVSRCLVDGKDAVVMGHVSQRLKSNGKAFTIPFALHLSVSNGLITRYHVYEDSLTVAKAVTA
ncbi:MAG TPA: nuclear transport factor 2 family protein [Rubrobacter sp.]|nr:nuclear transport factor 2 family protein [Rubrobacter sp.]